MTAAVTPAQQRYLRACMVCSIVQTDARFVSEGCPNCEFLNLRGSRETVLECTSQVFEGLITLQDPSTSWVARWQRLSDGVPGLYAVKVVGTLSEEIKQILEDAGARYVPRDGTVEDEEV